MDILSNPGDYQHGTYYEPLKDQVALRLRERYTSIKSSSETPTTHTVRLTVDGQSFCVTPVPCDTKEEAEWFRTQLAQALASVLAGWAKSL